MKKIFLLTVLAALTVVTCGKNDDNNGSGGGNTSVGKFLPPKWIQGSWLQCSKTTPSSTVMPLKPKIFAR